MRDVAGDEIIFAEKQKDNRFAYFTEGAKRIYMPFKEFLDAFKVPNRTYHYYYSFSEPPGKLNEDIQLPAIMDDLFLIEKVMLCRSGYDRLYFNIWPKNHRILCCDHQRGQNKFYCICPRSVDFTLSYRYSCCQLYLGISA